VTRRKIKPKPNEYAILSRAVEDGIRYGYRRCFKHRVEPMTDSDADVEQAVEEIERAVMNEVCEVWRFDHD